MKNLFLILFLCAPSFLIAQSNSKLEILSSIDYSYRNITNTGLVQTIRATEKGKLNSHFGINYYQKLKPKLWLKIGIGFASLGYKTEKKELITGGGLTGMPPNPLIPAGNKQTSQFIYNYHFLEVPFSLHLNFSEKKLKPFVEFGIVPMYYLQSITKHKVGDQTTENRNEQENIINDFQFASKIAFGFSYAFNEKWDLMVQPNFRYHLTKIVDAPVKEHLWSTGLAIGVRMGMK